ncbi:DNA translocase, putative [Trichomonas vaginalis G3]|uniref:DNA translocase, putative n=1 Tax=Trichomonas vaginalis (strain ATCC PRA-98 / G3) TaxID=412133 RepID=A2FP92_TRIV3|nr:hypothetical protein TVAGG3_0765270 [Trichomonas vaginalis G3]EAX93282.1 DNA translocase, putative [Trichomonas vaginalis G3]KAI5513478.1 hypothetical protein TVAGG3_0765270 [Trichomonas vaginalis G3]|eukprot:XP_001306212.1 DNA translocase [Trichomonas vaginalis G3]
MAYTYPRTVTQPIQPAPARPYQKVMYNTPQYYYQPPPQQPLYAAPAQQIIYQPPQQYQMVQYLPTSGQQAQPVYIPEDVYAQQMQMSMQQIPPQQPVRYVQPQQPAPIDPTPQPAAVVDPRRKKKEVPTSPQYTQVQQTYTQPKKAAPTPAQTYPTAQPIQVQTPVQTPPETEPLQSLENCLPKVPTSIISKEFSAPPGCFNIIRRGNLPGLSFSQI